jgi:hypothetical protein
VREMRELIAHAEGAEERRGRLRHTAKPKGGAARARKAMQRTTRDVQHVTCNMRVQHATCTLAACGARHVTCDRRLRTRVGSGLRLRLPARAAR